MITALVECSIITFSARHGVQRELKRRLLIHENFLLSEVHEVRQLWYVFCFVLLLPEVFFRSRYIGACLLSPRTDWIFGDELLRKQRQQPKSPENRWETWETQQNRLSEGKDTIRSNENTYAHTIIVAQSASWVLRIFRTYAHFRWTARIYTCTY